MKMLLITFAIGVVLATQAFAAEITGRAHIVWKNGHYVCSIVEND